MTEEQVKGDATAVRVMLLTLIADGVSPSHAIALSCEYLRTIVQSRMLTENMNKPPKEEWER